MKRRKAPARPDTGNYSLLGGEHLGVSAMDAKPGWAKVARNYEIDSDGHYRRYDGYERFDGRTKPSEASYWILPFTSGSAVLDEGDTVVGATSAAEGTFLDQVLESGSYAGGDAAGYYVLTGVSGTFTAGENLQISAVTKAVAVEDATEKAAATASLHNTYLQTAIEYARDQIEAPTGSGALLGGGTLNGVKYVWRNNAGGTAAVMFKATTAGWVECDLGETLEFSSGTAAFTENEWISQGSVLAQVKRVVLLDGSWAGSDAEGYLVIYNRAGGGFAPGAIAGGLGGAATADAIQSATTLQPGGRVETINRNFGGNASTRRMYGADGANYAFEWDGSTYVPIYTGMDEDTPSHVIGHKNHLFFVFPGGSLQHSSIANPYVVSAVTGADELGMGEDIIGAKTLPGDILCVKCRNSTHLLYGSAAAGDDPWVIKVHDPEAGGIEWTDQLVENILIAADDRGITTIQATDVYGDYKSATISESIDPFLKKKLNDIQCSLRVKEKTQYRLFFDDGQGIFLTLRRGKVLGFTRVLFPDIPLFTFSGEDANGKEELFFGDADGFLYQMDVGTSFDGAAVEAFVRFHYYFPKGPRVKVSPHSLVVHLDAPDQFDLKTYIEYEYGADLPSEAVDVAVAPTGGLWDIDEWGTFVWDGQDVGIGYVELRGTGTCFSPLFYSNDIYVRPHTLQALDFLYSVRGIKR